MAMSPEIKHVLRVPFLTMVALVSLLAVNVLLGSFFITGYAWVAEVAIAAVMVAIVILVGMEIRHESPLIQLFSGLGFFWVAILFSLIMVDYLTR
jgi:cytochrome c oxidase subunit 4